MPFKRDFLPRDEMDSTHKAVHVMLKHVILSTYQDGMVSHTAGALLAGSLKEG